MTRQPSAKRRGLAAAASFAAATGTLPLVLPAAPAAAADTTCSSGYSCFGNNAGKLSFAGNNPSWYPWIGHLGEYWSTWGRNSGTTGMRACGFWDINYSGLQVSLGAPPAADRFKTYSSRSMRSNKWSSTTCSAVATG